MFEDDDVNELPDDLEALEAIANEGMEEGSGNDTLDVQELDKEEGGEYIASDKKDVSTDNQQDADKDEITKDSDVSTDETKAPEGVLTKDGKHVIPFSVLEKEREEKLALERTNAELEARVNGLEVNDNQEVSLTEEETEKLKELAYDYGEEFAEQRKQEILENKQLKAQLEARNTQDVQSQTNEIQDAIDSSPLMLQWQSDRENSEWYSRANNVFEMLQTTDESFAGLSFAEQMAALPGRVEAMYGESEQGKLLREKPNASEKVQEKVDNAKKQNINSLSDFPAGVDSDNTEAETLSRLSGVEINSKLANMSDKQLEAYLHEL
jgi:predicted outer membrane protein